MTYVLDTHAIVWFLDDDTRLSASAIRAIRDAGSELVVPAIALAEIAFLYARDRICTSPAEVSARIANTANCTVYPLDQLVLERLPTQLDIHDAIIVATALLYRDVLRCDTALITRDEAIAASGLIDVVW